MNIPKVATAGQFALCEVEWRAGSARSPNCAVTPHNESLHIKPEMLSSTFQVVVAQQMEGAPKIVERQFVRLQECLLTGVRIGAVKRPRARP
jgi:hypothetical protein